MKKGLVIFGVGKIAEVVHYYAKEECGFNVVAFCVDAAYKKEDTFLGVRVVGFEDVEKSFPPADYHMFVAVGYHDLNRLRATKCAEARAKGYELISVVSPRANVPSNVRMGWNCFIMPPAIVHPCVTLGNDVFVWSGAMVGHHSQIGDHCWLTSACNISGNVVMGENTFVAVNATVGHSVKVGAKCFLGANSLVTKDLADGAVVINESSKPIRLNSEQFLRMSNFSNL
jgi:sugar O-acyltransferase (sialic acid O-acetyltransferase NeuD family)